MDNPNGRIHSAEERWSIERIEAVVRQLAPSVTEVAVTFPTAGVVRVLITAPSIVGIQKKVSTVLDQALPAVVQRVEVLVARG